MPPTIDLSARSRTSVRPATSNNAPVDTTTNPVTRTAVSLEYASLRHNEHCPVSSWKLFFLNSDGVTLFQLGMYIIPSTESLLVWDAVFFVHQGGFLGHLKILKILKMGPSQDITRTQY